MEVDLYLIQSHVYTWCIDTVCYYFNFKSLFEMIKYKIIHIQVDACIMCLNVMPILVFKLWNQIIFERVQL